jgi:hypothetical protein
MNVGFGTYFGLTVVAVVVIVVVLGVVGISLMINCGYCFGVVGGASVLLGGTGS